MADIIFKKNISVAVNTDFKRDQIKLKKAKIKTSKYCNF